MTFPVALGLDDNTGREKLSSIPQEGLCSQLPDLKVRLKSVVMTGDGVGKTYNCK